MLKPRTAEQAEAARADIERSLSRTVDRSVRRFLNLFTEEALKSARRDPYLVASGHREPYVTLGTVYGWWTSEVDGPVAAAVREAFRVAWHETSDGRITSASLEASEVYVARVSDRLVAGLVPPLPDDAFDAVRVSLANATAEGWSRDQLAERIAAELSWSPERTYWTKEREALASRIDAILDPLGEPGNPAREWARMNDPRVSSLQEQMARATRHLDADESHWKMRADRIARTESTGAANYGALNALEQEGAPGKQWLAALQPGRTRPAHLAADGQVQPLDAPFEVGGEALMMPGDPTGSPQNVVNCRCTIIASDITP